VHHVHIECDFIISGDACNSVLLVHEFSVFFFFKFGGGGGGVGDHPQ